MMDEKKFEGMKRQIIKENEAAYGKELREKYGEDAVEAHTARLRGMSQFPAEQDLLEAVHLLGPVEAVVVVPAPPGAEQADGVVVIQMTQTMERKVSVMCNLSRGVEEKGVTKGILASIKNLMETLGLTQAREAGQLFYGIHPFLHLLEPRINHDAASRSSVFFRLRAACHGRQRGLRRRLQARSVTRSDCQKSSPQEFSPKAKINFNYFFDGVLRMLDVLLSNETSEAEKRRILRDDYDIQMTQTMEIVL